jgi:hypothetical protein
VSRLDLLDSARHKLGLAAYHADSLLGILAQHPHDGPDEPLRLPLEAHLEGLAYTGTAAAEKTIRSLDPTAIADRASIAQMIRTAVGLESADEVDLARDFETWWTGRQRGTRYAEVARDLRNDAAHDVYEKAPDGPRWRMRLGNREPIFLDEFTNGYVGELDELELLIARAEHLADAAALR